MQDEVASFTQGNLNWSWISYPKLLILEFFDWILDFLDLILDSQIQEIPLIFDFRPLTYIIPLILDFGIR